MGTQRVQRTQQLRQRNRELEYRVRELECLFEIARAAERSPGELATLLEETLAILVRTWGGASPVPARIALEGVVRESAGYARPAGASRVPVVVYGQVAGEIEIGRTVDAPAPSAAAESAALPPLTVAEADRLLELVAQRLGRTTERLRRRRLLREKEDETRERLTHLTRVSTLGEMASSIAHEVNQPLTAIATYAQACRRLVDSGAADLPEVMDVMERISAEALRAGAILHRLKDLVRRHETHWTECDLNALVRDVQQLASIDARLHDVGLRFELTPDLPPVLADGIQLQQVILNLIRNGIDAVAEAAPAEPLVVVRTEPAAPAHVRLCVEDNGCGLAEELDRKLFQPFFTTKQGGMGMGLSISRSIAAAHRGTITFSRNGGSGMTFRFTLPILDEA